MESEVIREELERIEGILLDNNNWQDIELTRKWTNSQPSSAGVYILLQKEQIIYVGETGKLSGRISDMLDSRHHTVIRTIGEKYYKNVNVDCPRYSRRSAPSF